MHSIDNITKLCRGLTEDQLAQLENFIVAMLAIQPDQPDQPLATELKGDQPEAWSRLEAWLTSSHPFFVLKGFAGSGKSYLMKMLLTKPGNFIFSAPTNKASKILSVYLERQVKTTYSVLGLRMTEEDDKLVLTAASDLPDLGVNPILVIDEAGMIPAFMANLLREAASENGWRILFVGDPAQLNPIGETLSPVWSFAHPDHTVLMKTVIRYDNELLALSSRLRDCLRNKDYRLSKTSDRNVQFASSSAFDTAIRSCTDWRNNKIIAWRNKTVNSYNEMIRTHLGYTQPFVAGESILMSAPLMSDNNILAHTDEEFVIAGVEKRVFTFPEASIDAHALSLEDVGFRLYVPVNEGALSQLLNQRASYASSLTGAARKKAWSSFWEIKNTFQSVRYGYALTAHRAQGSTYNQVFVDMADITANKDKREAFRALYVACTRAKSAVTLK